MTDFGCAQKVGANLEVGLTRSTHRMDLLRQLAAKLVLRRYVFPEVHCYMFTIRYPIKAIERVPSVGGTWPSLKRIEL